MDKTELDLMAVIMAGGAGTRFWPLSTEERPKQFLKLFDERSLLQKSFDRIRRLIPPERILVLTNPTYLELAIEQLPELPRHNVIGEPMRRDTAAAVCLGAALGRRRFGDPVIVTLTADHVIEPIELFQKTLLSAARGARDGRTLYTLGIEPTHSATGYGYLELGRRVLDDDGIEHFELASFKEKPDRETAERYVESGRYLWNSGMFAWTAEAVLEEIEKHLPQHLERILRAVEFDQTGKWPEALAEAFGPLQKISIDYGVMEKAGRVRCVAAEFTWKDLGGWPALTEYLPGDEAGNRCRGRALTLDAGGNLVFCEDQQETVILIGVNDLVTVRAGDKTLIVHKDRTEEIKKLVEAALAS